MFKIELSDNSIFKDAFDAINAIVDEVICIVDSEGFRLNALDRSHISFVSLDFKPELFDEFECSEPERLALDTDELMKVLKRMKSTDILRLTSDDGNVIIKLMGDAEREFKIRVIDIEYESPQPPAIQHPCSLSIPSDMIKDCINDMELFSEKLTFMIDEDYLWVISDGEFGDASIKYLHGEDINEVVKAVFSIPKLKEIFKASKISKEVELFLGNDMPVSFKFHIDNENGQLGFLLAPRLEQDE